MKYSEESVASIINGISADGYLRGTPISRIRFSKDWPEYVKLACASQIIVRVDTIELSLSAV